MVLKWGRVDTGLLPRGKYRISHFWRCKDRKFFWNFQMFKEKIQKFRIQFLQGQVNMMEIVEEDSIIIYNIYIIYNNTTISQSDVWQP